MKSWLTALVLSVLVATRAVAQLADCPDIGNAAQTYKIVLSELQIATPAATASPALQGLRELLAFNLATQLAEFEADLATRADAGTISLGLVTCQGRRPSPTGAEFTPQRAEVLSDQRVVLELWGTLLDDPAGTGPPRPHAIIGYVIPPLLQAPVSSAPPGKQLVRYPKENTGDPTERLRKLPEAAALALTGLALKAQRARKYDLAVWAYQRSAAQVHDAEVANGLPNAAALSAFVKRAACDTRQAARQDPNYRGALKLLPAESCGAPP